MAEGIRRRGSSYEAYVWDSRSRRKLRRTFPTLQEARSWRQDAARALRRGELRSGSGVTLNQAAAELITSMRSGAIPTRSGQPYRLRVVSDYERLLKQRVLPGLGGRKLSSLAREDVQRLADRMAAKGDDASTIRNALMPLRVICRRALLRGEIAVNPTTGLELPPVRGRRDRVATPEDATRLIAALRIDDRALWGCAFYAGLRRGEIAALDWSSVALGDGELRVERAWDEHHRSFTPPKTRAGTRRVPLPPLLVTMLSEHAEATGRAAGLVFGATPERPFVASAVRRRSIRAWTKAKLAPIGLHQARHTFASLMIAAGVQPKVLSEVMGHSSIVVTLDRYGHLYPSAHADAAARLGTYLDASAR
jgi:integrase